MNSVVMYASRMPSLYFRFTDNYDLLHHLFADGMQWILHCLPSDVPQMTFTLSDWFVDVSRWCALKRSQLNASKTELVAFGIVTNLQKVPSKKRSHISCPSISESGVVFRDLGVMPDVHMLTREHVSRTAQACFFHLRRLCSVRQLVDHHITIKLVVVLVFSRLDYCNDPLVCLPTATTSSSCRISFGEWPTSSWPCYVGTQHII